MTPEQTTDLLTLMATFDQRTVGESDVYAWHAVVAPLAFEDARKAVIAYYAEVSGRRAMPADIRQRASVYADDRAMLDRRGGPPCGRPECSCTHTAPCDHGWIDAERGVTPCPQCRPDRQQKPGESRADYEARLQREDASWIRRRRAAS